MLIDWASDLHVTHHRIPKKSPVLLDWSALKNPGSCFLIIGGDSANDPDTFLRVVREASGYYDLVLACDGNHEHYSSKAYKMQTDDTLLYMKTGCDMIPNVLFMDGKRYFIYDGTLYIGCNGWYDFRIVPEHDRELSHWRWKKGSNDPKCIRFSRYPDKLAFEAAENLRELVIKAQDVSHISEIVVFTHTCPILKGLRRSTDPTWDQLNGAYGNSLMERVFDADTRGKIKVWFFGHTHFPNDFDYRGIRFICSPRGYESDDRMGGKEWERPFQFDTKADSVGSAFGEIER